MSEDKYKLLIAQFAVKSIDLEDHLRKDHLLMEVQVDFSDIHDISLIYFGLKQQQ